MNQQELARALSKKFDLSRRTSAHLIHFINDKITEAIGRGERFNLRGFGVFVRVRRAAKKVRHPKTGKIIAVPEHQTMDFRPSPEIKDRLKPLSTKNRMRGNRLRRR
jgi:DNA-binding protein HU-beta